MTRATRGRLWGSPVPREDPDQLSWRRAGAHYGVRPPADVPGLPPRGHLSARVRGVRGGDARAARKPHGPQDVPMGEEDGRLGAECVFGQGAGSGCEVVSLPFLHSSVWARSPNTHMYFVTRGNFQGYSLGDDDTCSYDALNHGSTSTIILSPRTIEAWSSTGKVLDKKTGSNST